jgi:hypothetical protein
MDETKIDPENEVKIDSKISIDTACVQHGREIMDTQLALIKDKGYDFAPQFQEMTIHLYLLGVIWRFAEGLDAKKNAREHAFAAIHSMLISDGMHEKNVQKRIEFLRKMSRLKDDSNAHAVEAGFHSEPGDNSLAELLDHYIDEERVSGAFWRLYERIKKTMLYGGLLVAFIAIWFVTLFLPGNSTISILAAGLLAATIFVIPVFLVGLLIYRFKIKKTKPSSSP